VNITYEDPMTESVCVKLHRILSATPDQAFAVPQMDRKTLAVAVAEMTSLHDRVAELTDAGRQGWAQLLHLNEWLQAHAPDDYAADNDTATAVLGVLDRQARTIAELRTQLAACERTDHNGTSAEPA
jgi:hypothetical protein